MQIQLGCAGDSLDIALRKELCRASACPAIVGMPGSMQASAKDAASVYGVAYLIGTILWKSAESKTHFNLFFFYGTTFGLISRRLFFPLFLFKIYFPFFLPFFSL